MISINKKVVVDEQGKPIEVIIPWEDFREIEELLGLDLDEEALEDLKEAKRDRDGNHKDTYQDLNSI